MKVKNTVFQNIRIFTFESSNRADPKLENTVKQSRFKHLGELHKEWTEAGVSASRVTTLRHLQEILEHFMLPSADKLYGDSDFIFQQDLAPAHTAKGTKCWFNDHGFTVFEWPANLPDLNPVENLEERHQTQQCR